MSLTKRRFCPETTLNNLQAQDQSLGLCLFVGVSYNLLRLERWTVNPYVASSSLARGANFNVVAYVCEGVPIPFLLLYVHH